MYIIHIILPNFFLADSSTLSTLNPSSPTDGGFIFFSIQFIKDLHSINKGSFLKGIVNNPVSSKAINENVEAEMDTKPIDNCKLDENTLFGFSRTCDNSEMMSKSLTQ